MDLVLAKIAEFTEKLANLKKLGNLKDECLLCEFLAEKHELLARHLKPDAEDRTGHWRKALQFYLSAWEIGADFGGKLRGRMGRFRVGICRILAEAGAWDDFEEFLKKNVAEEATKGEAWLRAGEVHSKRAGAQIPAILALEEARRLLNGCLSTGGVKCLLLSAECCTELAKVCKRELAFAEAQSHAESAISFLHTAKSMSGDDPLQMAHINGVLASVFWECLDDAEGALSFCLSSIDAFRGNEKLPKSYALAYCEQLALVGCLYRLQGDFRSSQTNLLLAKDEAMRIVASFELIKRIESEILLTTERSTQKKTRKSLKDSQLDPLTERFLATRDGVAASEALSLWTARRLQGEKEYQPLLKMDPEFSYFAGRKVTRAAAKLFGAGMNIRPKSRKKNSLDLKRPRKQCNSELRTEAKIYRNKAAIVEEVEDFTDFINDSDTESELENDEVESEVGEKEKFNSLTGKDSTLNDTGYDFDSLTPFTPPVQAKKRTTTERIILSSEDESIAQKTPIIKSSFFATAAVQEYPLMMFDSPIFTTEEAIEKENHDVEMINLTRQTQQSQMQQTQKSQRTFTTAVRRVTVKFADEAHDPILLPLMGLETIEDLLKRLQSRLDALKGDSSASKIVVEGVVKLPGRARMLPCDLINDVLVEEDELLAIVKGVEIAVKSVNADSIFIELAEKRKLLHLRKAHQFDLDFLNTFEGRLQQSLGQDSLDLSKMMIDSDKWREVLTLLKRFLHQTPTIKKLFLNSNCLFAGDLSLLLGQKGIGKLKHIDVTDNQIRECVYQGDWLESLNLSSNPVEKLQLSSIKKLSLADCPIQLKADLCGRWMSSCESLELSFVLDSQFLLSLTALKSLKVFRAEVPVSALSTLAMLPALSSVQFWFCWGFNGRAVCSFVRRCSVLRELKIVQCGLEEAEVVELKEVSFRDSSTLQVVEHFSYESEE